MAQNDPKLKVHLEISTIFRGTSSDIENDLIESVAKVIQKFIKKEVAESRFLPILLDEATDIEKNRKCLRVFGT